MRIYHLDDNLIALDPALGETVLANHGSDEIIGVRTEFLKASSLIYASTDELANQLSRLTDVPIHAGVIYRAFRGRLPGVDRNDEIVFGYMGSKSHAADLDMAVPAIKSALQRHPSVRFEIFGSIQLPQELKSFGERVAHVSPAPTYDKFMARLGELGWAFNLRRFGTASSTVARRKQNSSNIPKPA